MYQNTISSINQTTLHYQSNHSIILSDIALYGYSDAKKYEPKKVSVDEERIRYDKYLERLAYIKAQNFIAI